MAFGAVLWFFVAVVTTIVFPIAKQPLRNASIICASRTPLPAVRAVSLTTHVSWFVRIVAAVVIEVTHPQLGNASSVLASELSFSIALAVVCKLVRKKRKLLQKCLQMLTIWR